MSRIVSFTLEWEGHSVLVEYLPAIGWAVSLDGSLEALVSRSDHSFWRQHQGLRERVQQQIQAETLVGVA